MEGIGTNEEQKHYCYGELGASTAPRTATYASDRHITTYFHTHSCGATAKLNGYSHVSQDQLAS